jgi:hypothetical protein
MLIDRDPNYYIHHLAPLLWGEALQRTGSSIHHSVLTIRICEVGNVFAHTAALLTGRSGSIFHWINTLSFWISRPISMVHGFLAWYEDCPYDQQFTPFGLFLLASFVATFYINGKWMIKMCMPREKDLKKREEKEEETNGKTDGKIKGKWKSDLIKIGKKLTGKSKN